MNEVIINVRQDAGDDGFHVTMCHCVDSSKVPHHQAYIYFEVEEAGKEGIVLVLVNAGLAHPIGVRGFDPSEIIICKLLSHNVDWA